MRKTKRNTARYPYRAYPQTALLDIYIYDILGELSVPIHIYIYIHCRNRDFAIFSYL